MDLMKTEVEVANEANQQAIPFTPGELADLQLAFVGGGIGDVQI